MLDARMMAIVIEKKANKVRIELLQELLAGGIINQDGYAKARLICACKYSDAVDRIVDIDLNKHQGA